MVLWNLVGALNALGSAIAIFGTLLYLQATSKKKAEAEAEMSSKRKRRKKKYYYSGKIVHLSVIVNHVRIRLMLI